MYILKVELAGFAHELDCDLRERVSNSFLAWKINGGATTEIGNMRIRVGVKSSGFHMLNSTNLPPKRKY